MSVNADIMKPSQRQFAQPLFDVNRSAGSDKCAADFTSAQPTLPPPLCDDRVERTPDTKVPVSKIAKARAWLKRGLVDYAKHFGSREFLRNNFNAASIGCAISVIDQIWINGRM